MIIFTLSFFSTIIIWLCRHDILKMFYLLSYMFSIFHSLHCIYSLNDILDEKILTIIVFWSVHIVISLFCSVSSFIFSIFTFMLIITWLSVVIPDSPINLFVNEKE